MRIFLGKARDPALLKRRIVKTERSNKTLHHERRSTSREENPRSMEIINSLKGEKKNSKYEHLPTSSQYGQKITRKKQSVSPEFDRYSERKTFYTMEIKNKRESKLFNYNNKSFDNRLTSKEENPPLYPAINLKFSKDSFFPSKQLKLFRNKSDFLFHSNGTQQNPEQSEKNSPTKYLTTNSGAEITEESAHEIYKGEHTIPGPATQAQIESYENPLSNRLIREHIRQQNTSSPNTHIQSTQPTQTTQTTKHLEHTEHAHSITPPCNSYRAHSQSQEEGSTPLKGSISSASPPSHQKYRLIQNKNTKHMQTQSHSQRNKSHKLKNNNRSKGPNSNHINQNYDSHSEIDIFNTMSSANDKKIHPTNSGFKTRKLHARGFSDVSTQVQPNSGALNNDLKQDLEFTFNNERYFNSFRWMESKVGDAIQYKKNIKHRKRNSISSSKPNSQNKSLMQINETHNQNDMEVVNPLNSPFADYPEFKRYQQVPRTDYNFERIVTRKNFGDKSILNSKKFGRKNSKMIKKSKSIGSYGFLSKEMKDECNRERKRRVVGRNVEFTPLLISKGQNAGRDSSEDVETERKNKKFLLHPSNSAALQQGMTYNNDDDDLMNLNYNFYAQNKDIIPRTIMKDLNKDFIKETNQYYLNPNTNLQAMKNKYHQNLNDYFEALNSCR
jgi:hypothetical protein